MANLTPLFQIPVERPFFKPVSKTKNRYCRIPLTQILQYRFFILIPDFNLCFEGSIYVVSYIYKMGYEMKMGGRRFSFLLFVSDIR